MSQQGPETINRDFLLRGPAADYYQYGGLEALMEGGTRTGKTWGFLIKASVTADTHPGSRQLICRQTRKSMNESVLRDWREEILWSGHPAISPSASKEHQDLYRWKNGSEVFFAGLEGMHDTASPILSTKWDRIYICQAEECNTADLEVLTTRLSSFKTPYHQITYDVNPSAPSHPLNVRFSPEKLGPNKRRFPFRHYDNPLFYKGLYPNGEWTKEGAEYISILESTLTGVRRERFLLHKWVAAEGQILENWDPRIHSINAELEADGYGGWFLHVPGVGNPVRVAYFTAGVDWGWHPDPGAMQLWAYDSPRWHPGIRRFRVMEVVKLRWQREQWADLAEDWWRTYGVSFYSCDPSDPENINYFNIRLGRLNYRGAPRIAVKCPPIGGGHRRAKHHSAGIDLMREGLGGATGHVRSFFLKDAFPEGIDEELRRMGRPTCYEQEVESWVFELSPEGNATSKPDPKCDQHAIMCFAANTKIWTRDGERDVQDVMIGDTVLVPYEDEVVALWRSERPEDVYALEIAGRTLIGSGSHPLWTARGWRRLDEIHGEDVVVWEQRPSITTGSPGIGTQNRRPTSSGTTSIAASRAGASSCISTHGSGSAGVGGRVATSIIEMGTLATTESITLKRFLRRSTKLGTHIPRQRRISAHGGRILLARENDQWRLRAGGRTGLPDDELASYAAAALCPDPRIRELECAAIGVASNGGATLIPTITTAGVPRRAGRAIVYNLTVRRTSRYIAEGVMVANCAMYDETLNFVRGFGRLPRQDDVRSSDPAERLMAEMNREAAEQRRKDKKRRATWQ